MRQKGSIALFQYWNRIRDGRLAPTREDVEPAAIKTLLADIFMLEVNGRGQITFRLAGTRLCATYGQELKGCSFASLWRGSDHQMVTRLLSSVFIDRSVIVIEFHGFSKNNNSNGFEMLLLPLDSKGDGARCLGVVTACRRAYWLGTEPVIDANVDSVRTVSLDCDPVSVKEADRSTQRHRTTGRDATSPPRKVGHLTVYSGGKDQPPGT